MWLCFKNDDHPALGSCRGSIQALLSQQLPGYAERVERERRRAERAEQARLLDEAAWEWAHEVVRSTSVVLRARRACESLGAALWHAGVNVDQPLQEVMVGTSEGLLASSADAVRAEEYEEEEVDHMFVAEIDHDDIVGYVEDYMGARAVRRSVHGAPRRVCKEEAWIAGARVRAKAPAHAKKQKQAVVAGARGSLAEARHIRTLRRVQRISQDF